MADWGLRFKELAQHISGWSKDKSTKVGAVIVDDDRNPLAIGYNGFPRKCRDDVEERYERPLKYKWTEHAERNAVYNAARHGVSLEGCSMYIATLSDGFSLPCADCARAIIQSGIQTVFLQSLELPERWKESGQVALDMLKESGVNIIDVGQK